MGCVSVSMHVLANLFLPLEIKSRASLKVKREKKLA